MLILVSPLPATNQMEDYFPIPFIFLWSKFLNSIEYSFHYVTPFVRFPRFTYFDGFLYHVVNDEERKESFTSKDEEVSCGHIPDQLHRPERPGRDGTTSSRELQEKSTWKKIDRTLRKIIRH